jgi:plasmid replication initiation protein
MVAPNHNKYHHKYMKNLTIAKANFLTEASYRISLQEQRLIISCLNVIDGRSEIPKNVTVYASQYAENFRLTMKNAHRELYKAAEKLYDRSIIVKDPNQTTEFRWIQKKILKNQGEGMVTMIFTDEIIGYISQLKSHFTSYKIHHVSSLKSVYSMRLYELLIQFEKTGERIIRVDDFRGLLGLDDKYKQFKELKKFVINPAIKELNAKSNLTIELETLTKGRKVVSLIFNFKLEDQLKLDF